VFGVVLELFVVEEKLLTGGENKLGATVEALQNSVGILHGRLPKEGKTLKSAISPNNLPVPFPYLRAANNKKGPGRNDIQQRLQSLPGKPGRPGLRHHATLIESDYAKRKDRDKPPRP
jgi:hypothetical protein